jgi:predicted Fe-S protein YdhL (DUF1289 family)
MTVSSPCIKLCILDERSGLCQGCGRTVDEIGRWAALDEAGRLSIMAELPARLAVSRQTRLATSHRPPSRRPMKQI